MFILIFILIFVLVNIFLLKYSKLLLEASTRNESRYTSYKEFNIRNTRLYLDMFESNNSLELKRSELKNKTCKF